MALKTLTSLRSWWTQHWCQLPTSTFSILSLSVAFSPRFTEVLTQCASVDKTYASLYSRSGDLARVHTHVVQAEEVLTQEGSFAKMSWISGLCSFRAASVAILQDRTQHAIEEAERSVAINKLYKAPIGVRARSHHLLSKALAKNPDRQAESEEAHGRHKGFVPFCQRGAPISATTVIWHSKDWSP